MSASSKSILFSMVAAAGMAQGCADNHNWCGDGTEPVDGYCEGTGSDCGPGTHEVGGECVLDEDVVICGDGTEEVDGECVVITDTGLPPELDSVVSPTPYPGGGVMILRGDNFALSDSGTMHVTVAGVETTNVQVLTNNYLIADLPASAVVTVEVEITNDLGSDAMDFRYTGLYAAEGGCFDCGVIINPEAFGPPPPQPQPDLFVLDPRDGTAALVGPILSDGGTEIRPMTAMAFAPDGTLWGIEAVYPDNSGAAQAGLYTIDIDTAVATLAATLEVLNLGGKGENTNAGLPDMAFVGDVLYAWSLGNGGLVSIDTTDGAVTEIASGNYCYGCGLAATDAGTLLSGYGAYELDTYGVDGNFVEYANISYDSGSAISALTWLDGQLYATDGDGGQGMMRLDPATKTMVRVGPQTIYLDAIATPPGLDGTPGAAPEPEISKAVAYAHAFAADVDLVAYEPAAPPSPEPVLVRADEVLAPFAVTLTEDARGRRSASVDALGVTNGVTFHAGAGDVTLSRADYAGYRLVENRRGQLKLVDVATGRPVLRRITSIEPTR